MIRRILLTSVLAAVGPLLWAQTPGFVQLCWEPNSEPYLAGYHVYRATKADGPYQRIDEGPIPIPQFLDFGLEPDRLYHYRVSAVGSDSRESELSRELTVMAPSEATAHTGSTPVIQAVEGQLVILSAQRFGVARPQNGVWSQVSGRSVVLVPAGDGTSTFRAPAPGDGLPLVFRYVEGGPASHFAGGHRDVKVFASSASRR